MKAIYALFEEELTAGINVDGNIEFPFGGTPLTPVAVLGSDATAYQAEFRAWLNDVWLDDHRRRLDRLLKLHGNSGRFHSLVDAFRSDHVIPAVGSGMSKASGFPLWRDFVHQLRSFTSVSEEDINSMLDAGQYEEAVDRIAAEAGRHLFDERIEQSLRVIDPNSIDGPVRLLPALFPKLAISTNLDDVLEHAYAAVDQRFDEVLIGPRIEQYRKLKTSNKRLLLKIHGDCRESEGRVLSVAEYDAAYAANAPTRESLALICRNHVLLWIGCSLGVDRTVALLKDVVADDEAVPRHYAFLRLPKDDSYRVSREKLLAQRKVFPIWYDDLEDDDLSIMSLFVGLLDKSGKFAQLGGGN
ncbi:SIR2 family NAD-dependent protein deacylase [Pseudomonas syringae]|uniref:SIR2 family NAD-dependent protein deacylase n=1 Tax=Pseudomonas syringae TaxID=317 RepID=UPI0023FA4997|nr:SIR2 family protein [Pseudomonas syringae]MDF5832811.1 SIR2 family protein [Pseudomonas syringae]